VEVDFLNTVFKHVTSMTEFCEILQTRYCMNDVSFTEIEFYHTLEEMLFYCRGIDKLRLNLPFQLVGRHCNAATMILANTFKAFACRPEEDSANLKVLILENLPDIAVCHLWMNPMDIMNIMKVLHSVEHLVITLRRHEHDPQRASLFGSCLWNMVENADKLASLCFIGMDHDDRPPRGLKQTKYWQMGIEEWRVRSLPLPQVIMSNLTSLELKRVEIRANLLLRCAQNFGSSLAEIYLNEVYLKVEQSRSWNEDSRKVLWVGVPNTRPSDEDRWIAMELRCALPNLRVCRAAFLAYDQYLRDDVTCTPEFDLMDPCGLGRSISQRFVQVVMGVKQPKAPSGETIAYLPQDYANDYLVPRQHQEDESDGSYVEPPVTDHDTNAYQTAVANTTSRWYKGIDGLFPNCNPGTLSRLHYIAETACQGMNEIHQRRNEWTAGSSMLNEYADNLTEMDEMEDEI
jgi:hypothetical protein